MLEADKTRWNHTGALLAMTYNANRGRSQQPKTAADFNPYGAGDANPENNKPMTAERIKSLAAELNEAHGRKK
jgi:hypothetical protein